MVGINNLKARDSTLGNLGVVCSGRKMLSKFGQYCVSVPFKHKNQGMPEINNQLSGKRSEVYSKAQKNNTTHTPDNYAKADENRVSSTINITQHSAQASPLTAAKGYANYDARIEHAITTALDAKRCSDHLYDKSFSAPSLNNQDISEKASARGKRNSQVGSTKNEKGNIAKMTSQTQTKQQDFLRACCTWDSKTVSRLLDEGINPHFSGIDPNDKSRFVTPLILAVENGDDLTIKALIGQCDKLFLTTVKDAEASKKAKIVVNYAAPDGMTPLMVACKESPNIFDSCQLLVESGADINAVKNDGSTALMQAIISGKEHAVQLLLENKANTTCRRNDGIDAYHLAIKGNNQKIKNMVFNHGKKIFSITSKNPRHSTYYKACTSAIEKMDAYKKNIKQNPLKQFFIKTKLAVYTGGLKFSLLLGVVNARQIMEVKNKLEQYQKKLDDKGIQLEVIEQKFNHFREIENSLTTYSIYLYILSNGRCDKDLDSMLRNEISGIKKALGIAIEKREKYEKKLREAKGHY